MTSRPALMPPVAPVVGGLERKMIPVKTIAPIIKKATD
jgi:hypothetical protein